MNLNHLGQRDAQLKNLLKMSRQWQKIDRQIKQMLPHNLHAHVQTACIENNCLILSAANSMAASRLRMITPALLPQLQKISDIQITEIHIKVLPQNPSPERKNNLYLSNTARNALRTSAQQLSHHPQLAQALQKLADKAD